MNEEIFELTDEEETVIKAVIKRYFKVMTNEFWFDDVYSLGLIAIWKARKSYDDSKGMKYTTFAWKLVFNEIYSFKRTHFDKTKSLEFLSFDYEIDAEPMFDKFKWSVHFSDRFSDRTVDTMLKYQEWYSKQKPRQRFIADEMIKGTQQKEIAKMIGVSAERIRQDRIAMRSSFKDYVA